MASEGFHEPADSLSPRTRDLHRAIVSLMEELEAIDWYQQRVDATGDAALREILAHNRDEEKEHAAMVLEWLRRQDEGFDRYLRMYLFTDRPVLAIEEAGDGTEPPAPPRITGIGSLRKR
ncbi:MAG TPA: ferritin-like domain-containing protein [Methylomirabilota bacterium]|nr:ferritin-like domain-containing protein [Methylomirabilota bacterium]